MENYGYGFGALANLTDVVSFVNGGGENININSAATKGAGNDRWSHSSGTRKNGETIISIGPDSEVEKTSSLLQTLRNSVKAANTEWDSYVNSEGTWSIELTNVSVTAMRRYASGVKRWDLLLNSCVGHTTRSLWHAGVPTIYAFHPYMLNLQLFIRQTGIRLSPYIHQVY